MSRDIYIPLQLPFASSMMCILVTVKFGLQTYQTCPDYLFLISCAHQFSVLVHVIC